MIDFNVFKWSLKVARNKWWWRGYTAAVFLHVVTFHTSWGTMGWISGTALLLAGLYEALLLHVYGPGGEDE